MLSRKTAVYAVMLLVFLSMSFSLYAANAAEVSPEYLLNALISKIDDTLGQEMKTMELLSSTAELKSTDWVIAKSLVADYQKKTDYSLVWYAMPNGSYYRSDLNLVEKNLSDREYFPEVLSGKEVLGSLIIGKTSGKKSVVLAVPVFKNGEVVAILGNSIYCDRFSDYLDTTIGLGKEVSFFVMTEDGDVVFDSYEDEIFINPLTLGNESLAKASEKMLSEESGQVRYEFYGKMRTSFFKKSELTGWTYVVVVVDK